MTDVDHEAQPNQVTYGRHPKPESLAAVESSAPIPRIEIHAVTDLSTRWRTAASP